MVKFDPEKSKIPEQISAPLKGTDEPVLMDKVNVLLYGDGKRVRCAAEIVYCAAGDTCSLYRAGHCIQHRRMFGSSDVCKYGHVTCIEGFTSRAASFSGFRNFYRRDPAYSALSAAANLPMSIIAEDVCLSLSPVLVLHADDGTWTVDDKTSALLRSSDEVLSWVPISELSPDLLDQICKARPRDIFGQLIGTYSTETIPRLLDLIRQKLPDVYAALVERYPQYADVECDHKGRRAYFATLAEGSRVRFDGNEWEIRDGKLVGHDVIMRRNFSTFGVAAEVIVDIAEDVTVVIEDNSWVDDGTRFVGE